MVFYSLADVDDGPGGHGAVLTIDPDAPSPFDYVVDFVFGVGRLGVGLSGGKDVKAHAQPWSDKELVIGSAALAVGGYYIFQVERVHARPLAYIATGDLAGSPNSAVKPSASCLDRGTIPSSAHPRAR